MNLANGDPFCTHLCVIRPLTSLINLRHSHCKKSKFWAKGGFWITGFSLFKVLFSTHMFLYMNIYQSPNFFWRPTSIVHGLRDEYQSFWFCRSTSVTSEVIEAKFLIWFSSQIFSLRKSESIIKKSIGLAPDFIAKKPEKNVVCQNPWCHIEWVEIAAQWLFLRSLWQMRKTFLLGLRGRKTFFCYSHHLAHRTQCRTEMMLLMSSRLRVAKFTLTPLRTCAAAADEIYFSPVWIIARQTSALAIVR